MPKVGYTSVMSDSLTAHDLWPLVLKLPQDERMVLAKLALRSAVTDDQSAYQAVAPHPGEFDSKDEPLAWEGEGWEEFSAKG
jgi:hypothetical protein